MRVTLLMPSEQILQSINRQEQAILNDQTQISTGIQLTEPSSDPAAYTQDMAVTQSLQQTKTWQHVATSALSMAQSADQTLTQINQAANTAYTDALKILSPVGSAGFSALSETLTQLNESIGQLANTKVASVYVVGGAAGTAPWSGGTSTTVASAPAMQVQLGSHLAAAQNVDGGPAISAVMQAISKLAALTQAAQPGQSTWTNSVNSALKQLQSAQANLGGLQAEFGTNMQRLEAAQNILANASTSLTASQASLQDASIPAVVSQLSTQETVYRAVLQVSGRVLLPSLANYLSQIG